MFSPPALFSPRYQSAALQHVLVIPGYGPEDVLAKINPKACSYARACTAVLDCRAEANPLSGFL